MWKILIRSIPVNLRRDAGTYLLMGILVATGMYIAAAFTGITYSYYQAGEKNRLVSNGEDGQFQVDEPLDTRAEEAIAQNGYELERAFYFDVDMEDGSVLRVMKMRQRIDKIVLDNGELPKKDTEAVLEKCYAYFHGLNTSDSISMAGVDFFLSGIGSVIDYEMPTAVMNDFSSDSDAFGLLFVTDECYKNMLKSLVHDTREVYVYAYRLAEGASDEDLRQLLVDELELLPHLIDITSKENNNRMGSSEDDNAPYGAVGLITGVGLLILISMVFFLRIQLSLDKQSSSIGALLAMGVKKRDIYPMFLLPFALVALLGGLGGFLLSRIFTMAEVAGSKGFYSIPKVRMISHPLVFLYCVLMPPIVCTVMNLILMRKKMSQSEVSLLLARSDEKSGNGGIIAAMVVGTLIAAIIFMAGRGVGQYCTTVKERLPEEIRYEYVYELSGEQKEVPRGSLGAFAHVFSLEDHGYIRDIQFVGIENGDPYFDVNVDGLDGGIVISTAVASRYGLDIGDKLYAYDPLTRKPYEFDVRGMTDYSVMLTVFMNIGDLRTLLGCEGVAYNMVYSDSPLDYNMDQLLHYAAKKDLISPIEQLEPEVNTSRDTFYILAILFYTVMMIYLIQFAIVRSRKDIACLFAFGYRGNELIRVFTSKLFAVACASTAISMFVAYRISELIMPFLIASTPIGIMIDYHLPEYLIHLTGALAIIALSVVLGVKRIEGTDCLYYLRSRE